MSTCRSALTPAFRCASPPRCRSPATAAACLSLVEGRPIKVEGNPRHPAEPRRNRRVRRGGVLSLYDPDRSQAVRIGGSRWPGMRSGGVLQAQMQQRRIAERRRLAHPHRAHHLADAAPSVRCLLRRFPRRWYRYEPINDDAARAGAALAFGRPLTALPRLAMPQVVLALDADPLGPGPQQIAHGPDSTMPPRRSFRPGFLRLYAAEPAGR